MAKNKKQSKVEAKRKFSPLKWHLFILVVIGFVFFGNSIKNGFSMDDDLVTTTDVSVHPNVESGIAGIPKIFVSRFVENNKQSYSYRPVTTSSFAIQYSFFGDKDLATRASISHFINLLLFIVNGVLVYLVLLQLFEGKSTNIALIGAVLFIIHPIHSEVINNIKCRDELLVFMFGFLAILVLFKYVKTAIENRNHLLLFYAFILITLSVLSKKTGVTFAVTIPLIIYYFSKVKLINLLKIFGVVLFGALMLALFTKSLLPSAVVRENLFLENPLYIDNSLLKKIPMFFYTIGWYIKMMIAPYPLSYYYGYDALPLATWSHVLTWVGFMFVVPLTVLSFVRIKKKEIWSFGFLFFMFSIGGISNLLGIAPGIVAERFAYLPSFGLVVVLGYYGNELLVRFNHQKSSKYAMIFGSAVLFTLALVQNFNRNKVWESKLTLYRSDVVHNNRSTKSFSLLGQEYIRQAHQSKSNFKEFSAYADSSVIALKKSLEIYPGYWSSANNIGYVYQNFLMDNENAIKYFQIANGLRDGYSESLFGLAACMSVKIEACNKIQQCISYIQVDSVMTEDNTLPILDKSDAIFNVAIFQKEIEMSFGKSLQSKGVGLLNSNNHGAYVQELKLMLDNFNHLEKNILSEQFNYQKEILAPTAKALGMMNESNVNDLLKTIIQGVSFKYNLFNASYLKTKYSINTYEQFDAFQKELVTYQSDLIDSTISVHYLAIKSDSLEVRYYEEAAKFLHYHGREEAFVSVNNLGISQEGIKNKVQLHINLANIYNFKKEKELALEQIALALNNVIELRKNIINKDDTNKQLLLSNNSLIAKNVIKLGVQVCNNFGEFELAKSYTDKLSQY